MIIAVIAQKQQLLDKIYQFLTEFDDKHPFFSGLDGNNLHKVLTFKGGIQQISAVAEQEHPDLLLFEGTGQDEDELQILSRVTARFPNLGVIMLCPSQSPERLIEAMRVGVREALPLLPTREALLDAADRFRQRIKQANMPAKQGKVLAFIPCKGGSGATFLASNLAYALAAENNKQVALVDFNLQLGDASLFLSEEKPPASIADVARQIHRLDGMFLASSMLRILPNLGILVAPDEPEKATEIRPEHVGPLIQVAMKNYDFVILDIGRHLDAVSIRALDKADLIFPVVQQTLPFIRDARRLLDVFYSLGYGDEKLRLIVNRHDKRSEITLDDVRKTLNMQIFKVIPNNYAVVDESVNNGVPVVKLAGRSPVAKMLKEISGELAQNDGRNGRWLKKLFLLR